ncbi:unnamed protein product [Heterobilharzia americana]|nr:unnamed protein product [Heterobilharzia americana]
MKRSQINPKTSSVDGCLPDIDYSAMRMKNLDDLDLDKVLMEYECVQVQRADTNSDSKFNLTLTSNNPRNVGNDCYEDVLIESVDDKNGINSGDQIVQINGVSVRNLKQANQLLERCGKSVSLLLLRPINISNLGSEHSFSNDQVNENNVNNQRNQLPRIFPHTVYTTPDRLKQTMWLQQNIFREKLNLLSKINGMMDRDINVKETKSTSNMNDNQLNSTENHSERQSVINSKYEASTAELTSWTIRKSADGTRYITKKYKRSPELSTYRSFRLNDSNRYQSDKSLSTSQTNSSCSDVSEQHQTLTMHSKYASHLGNKSNHVHFSQKNNNSLVNTFISAKKELTQYSEPKMKTVGILNENTGSLYSQSNIPTSLLMKPPILFRRSHSANVSRNTSLHYDVERKHTSYTANQQYYNKQNNKLRSSSNQTSVSVVTI